MLREEMNPLPHSPHTLTRVLSHAEKATSTTGGGEDGEASETEEGEWQEEEGLGNGRREGTA